MDYGVDVLRFVVEQMPALRWVGDPVSIDICDRYWSGTA